MGKDIVKGQKVRLEELSEASVFEIGIACRISGSTPDVSCFGVDINGKLSDDRYFIFYNQKHSPEGAIKALGRNSDFDERFAVDLTKLPASIVRLVFVATIDGQATFASLSSGRFDIIFPDSRSAGYRFSGADFAGEKAVIIGEIYFKTLWRLSAVGQGFNGGLPALLKHFGGEEAASVGDFSTPPAPLKAEEPKVNLSKVRLDKQGEKHKISLTKNGGAQVFHINLQWDQPSGLKSGAGFLGRLLGRDGDGADLDLGCMWRDRQGNQGVIQPLGGNFGSQQSIPYIFLDKDDRSGAAADGENMRLFRPETMSLVVVFAMIYEGTANFSNVNARLTIFDSQGGEILIPLNAPDPQRTFCAVAALTGDGHSLQVVKEERYFKGHKDCDQYYGFGFRWVQGSK